MQIEFPHQGLILSLETQDDKSFHLLRAEVEFHFTSHHAFIFTHKTSQICSFLSLLIVNTSSAPHPHMLHSDLSSEKKRTAK